MTKRKMTKVQTTIFKTLQIELKNDQREPHYLKSQGLIQVLMKGKQFLLHYKHYVILARPGTILSVKKKRNFYICDTQF